MNVAEKLAGIFPAEDDIPAAHRIAPLDQRVWLIGGELRAWTGPVQEVLSPIHVLGPSGLHPRSIGRYPMLGAKESLEALDAAVRAWDQGRGPWPTMSVEERIRCLEDFTRRMKERRTDVVNLLMWEIGKSLADSEKEFDRTVDYVRDTVEALKELDHAGSRFTSALGIVGQIRRAPLGVVLCMGPFNYPLNETFTTLIPALAMGNPVIFKPPKVGVLLHQPLLEAFRAAFPPGVVNTVYGDGRTIITPLMESGKIDVLAFIGSSRVAASLKKLHPRPHRLRGILGLEAKNAAIVLADADLDLAVKECVLGSLSYNGQRCTAIKMIWAHRSLVDEFLRRFCDAVGALDAGAPWKPGVHLTPLAEPGKSQYFTEMLQECLKHGARVMNEGGGSVRESFFWPAVLYPVNERMRLWYEEQFGPMIPVAAFDDLDTPIRWVVDSNYGQQVALFGRDPEVLARLVDPLVNQVCRVNLNSQCQRGPDTFPFVGRKDSAEGTLSVSDALRCFSIRTLVAAKETPGNKELITRIVRERKSKFLSTDWLL